MSDNESTRWMPAAAGILNIISGVLGLLGSLVFFFMGSFFNWIQDHYYTGPGTDNVPMAFWWAMALFLMVISIVALAGGILAVQRKQWTVSLFGGIAAILQGMNILGIIATVFLALSKKEFTS